MKCKDCKNFRDIDGGECFFACGAVPPDCDINIVCENKFEHIADVNKVLPREKSTWSDYIFVYKNKYGVTVSLYDK